MLNVMDYVGEERVCAGEGEEKACTGEEFVVSVMRSSHLLLRSIAGETDEDLLV